MPHHQHKFSQIWVQCEPSCFMWMDRHTLHTLQMLSITMHTPKHNELWYTQLLPECINFEKKKKIYKWSPNSRCQKCNMRKIPFWGPLIMEWLIILVLSSTFWFVTWTATYLCRCEKKYNNYAENPRHNNLKFSHLGNQVPDTCAPSFHTLKNILADSIVMCNKL
jgi:hypothetical protein